MMRMSTHLYTTNGFYEESIVSFDKYFWASDERTKWSLYFLLWMSQIPLFDFQMLNHPCIPEFKRIWSWWIILLMYCRNLLVRILVRILHPYPSRILVCNSPFQLDLCLLLRSRKCYHWIMSLEVSFNFYLWNIFMIGIKLS